jgi:signal transduction histidine kinase
MRRLSLVSLLIALDAGLVLAAVAGMAVGAMRELRQLTDRDALLRVDAGAQSAVAAIERAGSRALESARLAAGLPALGGIAAAGDRAALADWLERFRARGQLTGCALLAAGRPLAAAGPPLPWPELRHAGGGASLIIGADGVMMLGGTAVSGPGGARGGGAIPGAAAGAERPAVATGAPSARDAVRAPLAAGALQAPGGMAAAGPPVAAVEVVTALVLDGAYAQQLGRQVGMSVELLGGRQAGLAAAPAAAQRERAMALPAGGPLASRIEAAGRYVADRPLAGPAGDAVGLVETSLPAAAVDASLAGFSRRLLLLAACVAVLATLASALGGRWLVRPVRALTGSAARLGRGDLTTPIGRAPGRELGALAATLEETRRRLLRLTAELRRRQAESETVLGGIAEGVLSVDRDRRIRYLNPQAAALLGLRESEALGRFCGDVLNPRGAGSERPCEDGCPIVHARFRGTARATEQLQLGGGRRRSVVITSAGPVEDRQVLVLRDETDVEVARRQRDAVLANISHEFKTPLAAQRASIELLRDQLLDRESAAGTADGRAGAEKDRELQELVVSLERGGLRLTQLIDNLLESVRIESGQDRLRRGAVALDEVVEEAVEMTAPLFAQRRQRVEVQLPYPMPPVEGDAPRLTQVLVNLLANAQKFAPAGSTLGVGGRVGASVVELWVDDEGPGLPESAETGRELFRRFVRSPAEMAEPEQSGMGLGLWIVQSIVERHGGTVEAERRGQGRPGTRIRITLPRADQAPRAEPPAAAATAGTSLGAPAGEGEPAGQAAAAGAVRSAVAVEQGGKG